MDDHKFIEREFERSKRLEDFIKLETTNMYVEARFQFVINIFNHFQPEIKELIKKNIIKGVE